MLLLLQLIMMLISRSVYLTCILSLYSIDKPSTRETFLSSSLLKFTAGTHF